MNSRTRKNLRILAWILFGLYLISLCYFLFFAEITGRTGNSYEERTYHYNLTPLKEISRFIKYRKSLGGFAVFSNLFGNVAAFIPYGMLIPLLTHWSRSFWKIVLFSFEFSLLVELVQLVSKVGSFDVDDLILNTLGGAIGFVCFLIANHWRNGLTPDDKKEV